MAIKHSAGCSCCGCDWSTPQYVSPTTWQTVADSTATVLSPTFETYNHYRFSGDLFAGFFGSDATRTMTMEFISEDENTVYDTITWQYNDQWDLYSTNGDCARGSSGEWKFNYKGGWGFAKSGGDQFSIRTEDREIPPASSYVTIASVTSADSARDTISAGAGCVVRAYPTGEVQRPCHPSPDSSCPCSSENEQGMIEWGISHDGWATASGNDTIPAFDQYRFWTQTFDDDSCVAVNEFNCNGLTEMRSNYVVYNYAGQQASATQDWADGVQTKSTAASSNSGATTSGYGGYVALTPTCVTGHYSQPSTTTSIYHYTDAGSGAFNVAVHQNTVKTLSGQSITLQVVRQAADIACTVVVSVSNGADQTINMAVGELVKNFSVTAPTTTTGKEEPDVNDSIATASFSSALNGIRVKEDVIEFEGNGIMVAHGKCMMNTINFGAEINPYGYWFPLDRKSWSDTNFKIRLTNNGGTIRYSSYDYKLIKNDELDCYDLANNQCLPEYVCSDKAEYHYNPVKAGNFGGAISAEFPSELRTEVNKCTTRTIMQDFSGVSLLNDGYGGTLYLYGAHRQTIRNVDNGSLVVPRYTPPTNGSYNTAFGAYCFNDGNRYYYQTRFVYDELPSGFVGVDTSTYGVTQGTLVDNLTCGTTAATTSQFSITTLSNVGTNATQHALSWGNVSAGWVSNAGSSSGWRSENYTSGTCTVDLDNSIKQERNPASSGIDSLIIEATIVRPVVTSSWPPDLAIPTDAENQVYITQGTFKGLMFGEGTTHHDTFLGQTELYLTDDTSLPALQSSDFTTLIDNGATLWVQIDGATDPADDGYYTLDNNGGTVELNVASKTSTEPTLDPELTGIEAAITANHLTHSSFESQPTDLYGTFPPISNDMTYSIVIGGVNHANAIYATKLPMTEQYQYETGGRAKWRQDNDYSAVFGYLGYNTWVFDTGTGGIGSSCQWTNSHTPQEVITNSASSNFQLYNQTYDFTRELYTSHENHPTNPYTCVGEYTKHSAGSAPIQEGEPVRTTDDFISEDHRVIVDDGSTPTVVPVSKQVDWVQAFGASDIVNRACCNGESNQTGTLNGGYFDLSTEPEYSVSWNLWFERLVETRTELVSLGTSDPPWGAPSMVESSILMRKRWVDCWDGMPSSFPTQSYGSSDFVSGQDPIRIFDSVEMSNVRPAGSLNNDDEFEFVIADVNIKSHTADFSTLTFDLTGLSW